MAKNTKTLTAVAPVTPQVKEVLAQYLETYGSECQIPLQEVAKLWRDDPAFENCEYLRSLEAERGLLDTEETAEDEAEEEQAEAEVANLVSKSAEEWHMKANPQAVALGKKLQGSGLFIAILESAQETRRKAKRDLGEVAFALSKTLSIQEMEEAPEPGSKAKDKKYSAMIEKGLNVLVDIPSKVGDPSYFGAMYASTEEGISLRLKLNEVNAYLGSKGNSSVLTRPEYIQHQDMGWMKDEQAALTQDIAAGTKFLRDAWSINLKFARMEKELKNCFARWRLSKDAEGKEFLERRATSIEVYAKRRDTQDPQSFVLERKWINPRSFLRVDLEHVKKFADHWVAFEVPRAPRGSKDQHLKVIIQSVGQTQDAFQQLTDTYINDKQAAANKAGLQAALLKKDNEVFVVNFFNFLDYCDGLRSMPAVQAIYATAVANLAKVAAATGNAPAPEKKAS